MALNRRITERVAVEATEIPWEALEERGAVAGPAATQRALLMDLSVTGAGLVGPAEPAVGVGDWVIIGFHNARAVVDVRRVIPTDDADQRFYWVELVSKEPAFGCQVHELIARRNALLRLSIA